MADTKDHVLGNGGQAAAIRKFYDEGDGTYAMAEAGLMYAWDSNALAWTKVLVDATGKLIVTTAAAASGTATKSSVGDAAADTPLLASNPARLGAIIFNDSTANLYLSLGTAAASTSSFTTILNQNGTFEVPYSFTGQIRGIWASDAGGNARVTEFTA